MSVQLCFDGTVAGTGATQADGPRRTQRLGAYAVAFRESAGVREALLTRISPTGFPAGWWTLPGGGVDHGESPHEAVVRELYEETGLAALTSRLIDVHDIHVVDHGRDDMYEDYHGVHLLYAVTVDVRQSPRVVEVGGSTDFATWVPVDAVGVEYTPVLPMVEHVLSHVSDFVVVEQN